MSLKEILKKNILSKYFEKFLTDTLVKMSQIFLHILLFQNTISILFYFERKKIAFFSGFGGGG